MGTLLQGGSLGPTARVEREAPPTKVALSALFGQTLEELSLDRVLPEKVRCRDGVLEVGKEKIDLGRYARVIAVAIGKAAYQMSEVIAKIIAPVPMTGVVSGSSAVQRRLSGFSCFRGAHPYRDRHSLASGEEVLQTLRRVTSKDLVLYILSGGGSSICEKPIRAEISVDDCHEVYRLLVTCGAGIIDVNYIRKHFSAVKGGRLTELAYPARQVTLYVSDAPPGNPSNVASGPTMPDESTVEDCYRIAREYDLLPRLPRSIRRMFEEESIPETPKPGAEIFRTSSWHCLLTPEEAVAVLARKVRGRGWAVETDLSINDDCPLRRASGQLLARLETLRRANPGRTAAIVTGGEYSCPVKGNGVGGRNQAFVLDCVPLISGRNIAVLSAGTDGLDGVSLAAGAVADGDTLARATRIGLDPFDFARRADSYHFFAPLGDTIVTGPTGNNVRDLRILVAW